MIHQIRVKGLFGLYDYDIAFPQKPAVKLLTGPNGYGKTTLLKAIYHLFKGNFWFFHFLDFKEISVTVSDLDGGYKVSILKHSVPRSEPLLLEMDDESLEIDDESLLDINDELAYEEIVRLTDKSDSVIESFTVNSKYIQSLLTKARRDGYRDNSSMHNEDLLESSYDANEDDYLQYHCKNISLALQEFNTRYLSAQRVFTKEIVRQPMRAIRHYTYEIDRVNHDIGFLYRKAQNEFATKSQQIDATFIKRLVQRSDSYSRDELRNKLNLLKKRIGDFKELNIISNMELMDYSLDDDTSYKDLKKVLSLYVDDMNDKMDRFAELYQKMSLFKRVVTNKVLSEKTIELSEDGLTVININGRVLGDLHKLSSGEQNLLILYFDLIFRSNGKTILLIDEPENSLHVAWQSKMLDDYIEMANTTGCQIVLATHSPTFVNGRWDLTTDLYRQFKGID